MSCWIGRVRVEDSEPNLRGRLFRALDHQALGMHERHLQGAIDWRFSHGVAVNLSSCVAITVTFDVSLNQVELSFLTNWKVLVGNYSNWELQFLC